MPDFFKNFLYRISLALWCILMLVTSVTAQPQILADTVEATAAPAPKFHSPKKASILSAVVPGAGQVYNKQAWKVPIVYAALFVPFYRARVNSASYNEAKQAYFFAKENIGSPVPKYSHLRESDILEIMNNYRRNRDYSYLFMTLAYVLNIVDASVYAHLFYFDVTEDISLNIRPYYDPSGYTGSGLQLVLNL